MKVLHVNKFLYRRGGAEGYMLDVAALQVEWGHEVAFFGMQHPDNEAQRFEAAFPPYLELDPPPAGLPGKLRAAGRMVWSSTAKHGMERVVDDWQPDVVHLHNIYHQLSPSVLRPLARAGLPMVMTLHDYKLACPTYSFLAKGEICEACLGGRYHQAVLRGCKDGSRLASGLLAVESWLHSTLDAYGPVGLFLAPSHFLASKMVAAGIDPGRLRVLNNFVDAPRVQPRVGPGEGLVFTGRLAEEKGVDVLLDALDLLPASVSLDVVGDGPQRPALEARAAASAKGRVRFHGRLARSEVLRHLREARLAVLPARWYENQPLAVLEAFACGVPVVASGIGGLPELVEPGRTGSLTPMNDPVALAAAIKPFVLDPALAVQMGEAARRRAEEDFSPSTHLDRLHALYAEAGDRRTSPGDPPKPSENGVARYGRGVRRDGVG